MRVQIILDNVWPTVTLGTKVQNVLGQKANNSLPKMHLNRWKSAKWLDILIGKIHKYRKKEIAYGDWKTSFVLQMVQLIKYCFTYFISFYFLFSNNHLHTVHNLPSRRAAQTNWTIILGVETLPLKLFFSSTICKGQLCDLYYKLEYIHPEIGWKILSSSIYCTIWSFYIHIL